jgi:hypothetical protein
MATQGRWIGDWPGAWFGSQGESTTAAPRSLLAFWAGGAVVGVAPAEQAAVRSMLAPWAGGAVVGATPTEQAAVRSLLAFWMGGAAPGPETEPPVVPPIFGGGVFTVPRDLIDAQRRRQIEADDLLLLIAGAVATGMMQ